MSRLVRYALTKYKINSFSVLSRPRSLWSYKIQNQQLLCFCRVTVRYARQKTDYISLIVVRGCTSHVTIIFIPRFTMKRSSAPSLNQKIPKVSKNSHTREASVRAPSQSKSIKLLPAQPSLTAPQLKALHYLLAAASYLSVLEGNTLSKAGLRDKCYQAYHGIDDDQVGVVRNFMDGTGRFEILWQNGRIHNGYGHLSGISHESIYAVIKKPTLKGLNDISGRQILEKGKLALQDAKKYLAYWNEFMINGCLPSGMNEENALHHVMKRAMEETSLELGNDEESGLFRHVVFNSPISL